MSSTDHDKSGEKEIFISQETVRRLIRDVKQIRNCPLDSNGIYYIHDDTNLLKGYALIIGPSDTVYENGYYFFAFDFHPNYPATPPKVSFLTNQQCVRFNPNLYVNGKVCLSMLNTWKGEQWTSCQTISTILLTLCTIFTNKPLLNEPGIKENHRDFFPYNEIIAYKNIEIAILNIINRNSDIYLPCFELFRDVVEKHFRESFLITQSKVEREAIRYGNSFIMETTLYNMSYTLNYQQLSMFVQETIKAKITTSEKIHAKTTLKQESKDNSCVIPKTRAKKLKVTVKSKTGSKSSGPDKKIESTSK